MNVWYTLVEWLPFSFLQYDFIKNALLAILLIAPIFGLAGTMVVNNRMSYFSDALGHSALAGIALGTLLGLQDFLLSMILFSVLFGWLLSGIKNRARSSTDTIIGVFSATAVALGIALLSRQGGFTRYSNFLIGDILAIRPSDILILLIVLVLLLLFWILFFNRLLILSVNASLARSKGISVRALEIAFMTLIAVLVTVSIKWIGTLLINALLILPAAAARNVAGSIRSYHGLSVLFSLVSGVSGLILSFYLDTSAGATIVLCSAVIFAVSWLVGRGKTDSREEP
ncbi:MAG: metal ABC transporter permease [Saccharofermentanales bacterium]|jgi:zinc transport system permease protein|nr:metal ABC transporter permease [Clostridiaceae bacterium]